MGDGSGDLQRVWHEFAAELYAAWRPGTTLLDLGAGVGRSKDRLSVAGLRVTTHDIERSRMLCVDMIADPERIRGTWDVVTAFDVVEHATDPQRFLAAAWRLARWELFFTTPNVVASPAPWHWTLDELREMVRIYDRDPVIYCRRKDAEHEWIEPGATPDAVAFGLRLRKRSHSAPGAVGT